MVKDKIIVITGASDGIGAAAAKKLHTDGANIIIVGRSPEKTKAVADDLGVPYYLADFAKLSDVRTLAFNLQKDLPRIDILVNNAGGIFSKRTETVDGHELTMQVNHLAPFLLTTLLLDTLISSNAVIINTSSVANKILAKFDIHDLENEKNYSPNAAYGNAKLANILFTRELDTRYSQNGITTAAFHPGNVATNFAHESTSILRFIYKTFLNKFLLTSEQGADTLVWLATSTPGSDWQSGAYYVKRKVSDKINPVVSQPDLARELWEWSEEATKK